MAAPNQSIFRNLSAQMPGQNKQVVSGLQEAAKSQMQAQLGGAQPLGQPMGIRQVQQMGAQATAAQAQPILQVQQQAQQEAAKLGQLSLQEKQQQTQKQLQERQFNIQRGQREMESQLGTLNKELKQRLLDDQFSFQKDELGRTLFNERQLLDYKLATAKSGVELKELEQKMRQTSQRKIQMLKTAQAKLNQGLTQEFQKGQQELDQAQRKRLIQAKVEIDKKIAREQARAKNRGSMFSAIGTLAGVAIGGALIASGVGAPAGAAITTQAILGGAAAGGSIVGGAGSILAGTTKI